MPFAVAAALGYLIGSVPFAYLVVRWQRGFDLHAAGSANVGARNAYGTTGSRAVGAAVLLLDLFKGVAAVLLGWWLAREAFRLDDQLAGERLVWWMGAAALLGALAGHIYNLWLSRKTGRLTGGKGFATAAGGFLLLAPGLVASWLLLFLAGVLAFRAWKGRTALIPGNVAASALTPLAAWPLYAWPGVLVAGAFALMTLPRHRAQLRALLREENP